MNWITNFVRPKISALVNKKEVPDNLWHKCPGCEAMLFHRDLLKNLNVCHHCGAHMKIDIEARLKMLFDGGKYEVVELPKTKADPLKFRDLKKYSDRIKDARNKTGRQDAIVVAHGKMGGKPVVMACFDFSFMGGSMGTAVGDGLLTGARLAVLQQAPFIVIPASGGARMQEGILSLMQMPRSVIAVEQVKEAGLPYVVLLTDPTTGGVSASFAMLGDFHIAEPGAMIGFAGRRVIEETIRENLPDGFQTAEYLLEHGMVDMVVPRTKLRDQLITLFDLLQNPQVTKQKQKDKKIEVTLDQEKEAGAPAKVAKANGKMPEDQEGAGADSAATPDKKDSDG